ncbi:MAG: T9SS type A sorting domain-containing protein [Bacteroidota bacterium]
MKVIKFIFAIVSASIQIFAQADHSIILTKTYGELPFQIRIENSGIYGLASFDIRESEIDIFEFDLPRKHTYKENRLSASAEELSVMGKEKKIFLNDKVAAGVLRDGKYSFKGNENVSVTVSEKSSLKINVTFENLNSDIDLFFENDLAYAEVIGIDRNNNIFVLIEKFLTEIPLKIDRQVYCLNKDGKILSILDLPEIKYLYTLSDLQIDSFGNLYHLLSDEKGIEIHKWKGLVNSTESFITYPAKYKRELNYNSIVPASEPEINNSISMLNKSSRTYSLLIGEEYVYHKYYCTAKNLAPVNVQAPDGDWVRTPAGLIEGYNARVGYKWGGFNTIEQYDAGLAAGKYAADIHTAGVTSYAVGVDCSGFVSRCWQMSYHASTAYMPNITTLYSSWSDLKPGDAVHKVGHVRLFIEHNNDGSLKIVESSGRDWGVSYWTYAPSDLTDYAPRYYNNMVDDFTDNRPSIISVTKFNRSLVEIKWQANSSDAVGYRLYKSVDGKVWQQIYDENILTTTSAIDAVDNSAFYRVSSVKANSELSESNLSNLMCINPSGSGKKYLIVDGFSRENGSWRGPGHNFILRYGLALDSNNVSFESTKNSEVISGNIDLNNYAGIFWMVGDESTTDESLSDVEQIKLRNYLETGGNLFISGSEIGWDLYNKGTTADKDFYQNYLKAIYISDDAGSESVDGVSSTVMENRSFNFGQTYTEDYPDEIAQYGGSTLCMKYSNNKGAGIQYSGKFGDSGLNSKLIYLAFPLETTANDLEFKRVVSQAVSFFNDIVSANEDNNLPTEFSLEQNYPNPFNPTTTIKFSIPSIVERTSVRGNSDINVALRVYDILGREIQTLINGEMESGNYEVVFDATSNGGQLSSGIYFYTLQMGNKRLTKKMTLIR